MYYRMDHCWVKSQGPNPDLNLRRVLSCDRGCSLCINFVRRLKTEFPDASALHAAASNLIWVIPKMHIHGHTERCQYQFHLAFTEGVGRTDGEGVERVWVDTKAIAIISRDASPAARTDIINSEHNWANWVRALNIGMCGNFVHIIG